MLTNLQQIHLNLLHSKTAETTGDLIGNKIADRITKVSKDLYQTNSETLVNEYDKEIPKERYISSKEKQEIIDEPRLKQYNSRISKITKVSKNSQQNNPETAANENDKDKHK